MLRFPSKVRTRVLTYYSEINLFMVYFVKEVEVII